MPNTIILSDTAEVEKVRPIVEEFMQRIFDMPPEDYLITDESQLMDFEIMLVSQELPGSELSLQETVAISEELCETKFRKEYGIEVSPLDSLVQVAEKIIAKTAQ